MEKIIFTNQKQVPEDLLSKTKMRKLGLIPIGEAKAQIRVGGNLFDLFSKSESLTEIALKNIQEETFCLFEKLCKYKVEVKKDKEGKQKGEEWLYNTFAINPKDCREWEYKKCMNILNIIKPIILKKNL